MFWIFANDKNKPLAPDDTALGATFANGGRYFHNSISLLTAYLTTAKGLIILVVFLFVYILRLSCLVHLQDSQDEGFTFGDGD